MTNPIIKVVNAKTGEEIQREMNETELTEYKSEIAAANDLAKEANIRAAARQSALEKLAALGLTEAEIQALSA